jgi:transcriptional regulator
MNDEISFQSSEGLRFNADVNVSYQLTGAQVPRFYVKFRSDDLEQFTHGFFRDAVRNAFKLSTAYRAEDINGVRQSELIDRELDQVRQAMAQWGPQHGHGIGQALRARSEDALQIEHGSLYPALHRLEREGWLSSEWKASEANRRAKYYRLTAAGKRQLSREQSKWDEMVATIARIMRPSEGG